MNFVIGLLIVVAASRLGKKMCQSFLVLSAFIAATVTKTTSLSLAYSKPDPVLAPLAE